MFGYQRSAFGSGIDFTGTHAVTTPPCNQNAAPVVRVFGNHENSIQTYSAPQQDTHVYLWGVTVQQSVESRRIPEWCAHVGSRRDYARLSELLGSFVVILDEPRQQRITFVSDRLGVRKRLRRFEQRAVEAGLDFQWDAV